jgi:hypothetical protein
MVGKSLEWLTDQSSAIGIYIVTAVQTNPAGDTFSCHLRREHSIRGDCPENASDEYFKSIRWPSVRTNAVVIGDRFLVFWVGETNKSVHETINLTAPLTSGFRHIAADVDQNLLTDGGTIVSVVTNRMQTMPHPEKVKGEGLTVKEYWIEVDMGRRLFQALYSGSSCFLMVPKDIKEKRAANKVPEGTARKLAAPQR